MYNIEWLRETEFPLTQTEIYFQNAGIAPLPVRTRDRMQWAVAGLSAQPSNFWVSDVIPLAQAFQSELATLIHAAEAAEIVPITTTSAGLNLVAQAIPWQPGDNLAFCELEFPANAYPWLSLARDGVEARPVPAIDGGLTLEALAQMVDGRTRLVAASAIQFFTGHRTDLAAIGAFCRERGIWFVVDAIQAIGHIPIDVQAMNIDILATGGQKSLLAAPGIGFLYVRREVAAQMEPRQISSTSTRNYLHWLHYDLTPADAAQRFSGGSPNLVGMAGVVESVRLLQELGIAAIDAHTQGLTAVAHQTLTDLGYHVITPSTAYGPIVTCHSGRSQADTDALIHYLSDQHITITKHLDRPGNPYLRLSFHAYNTAAEIGQFAQVMQQWATK